MHWLDDVCICLELQNGAYEVDLQRGALLLDLLGIDLQSACACNSQSEVQDKSSCRFDVHEFSDVNPMEQRPEDDVPLWALTNVRTRMELVLKAVT